MTSKYLCLIAVVSMLQGCIQPADTSVRSVKSAEKQAVAKSLAIYATAELGLTWVPTALKIAKVESNFNCGAIGPQTKYGHAYGLMQNLYGSAVSLGFAGRPIDLLKCDVGVKYGVAHMRRCLERGADTEAKMAACHVGGVPWAVNFYARQYVALVIAAKP